MKQCLLDEVSASIRALFPSVDDMQGPKAQSMLQALALLAIVDISQIEARHASIRRVLELSSVQTWRSEFSKLSAMFTLRQNSLRAANRFSSDSDFPKSRKKHIPRRVALVAIAVSSKLLDVDSSYS